MTHLLERFFSYLFTKCSNLKTLKEKRRWERMPEKLFGHLKIFKKIDFYFRITVIIFYCFLFVIYDNMSSIMLSSDSELCSVFSYFKGNQKKRKQQKNGIFYFFTLRLVFCLLFLYGILPITVISSIALSFRLFKRKRIKINTQINNPIRNTCTHIFPISVA